ncbi:MAG: prepilin-type N-terminal cleavage/methylation domain-containing protein [Planctomycetota bacterium]|nr:prepilin-type N-terminal cleavage/methylation domain-containing protein [Planctomycetota bacterium]
MNRPTGFTIAEVLMALSVASVIALAAGGVATGLSYSYQHQDDYRQSVQDASGIIREMRMQVSKAQLITGVWGTAVAIWTDTNADMKETMSEMVLIQYNSAAKQLTETRLIFPAGWTQTQITAQDTNITFNEAMQLAKVLEKFGQNTYAQTLVLAEDVQAFSVTGAATGSNNNVIQVSATVSTGAKQISIRSQMGLRASLIGKV